MANWPFASWDIAHLSPAEVGLALGALLISYLLGAVPVGYLIGRYVFKRDLFVHGSRSMGATNVVRVLGARAGLAVFSIDVLKGALPALAIGLAMPSRPEFQAIVGIAAVVGHSWSLWVGFRGGRGVATAIGAGLVIFPVAMLAALPVGVALAIVLRYVSIGSISGSIIALCSGMALYFSGWWPSMWGLVFMTLAVVLILWQHRYNMLRLVQGTELRMAAWPTYLQSNRDGAEERPSTEV